MLNPAFCCTTCTTSFYPTADKGYKWYSNILTTYTIPIPTYTVMQSKKYEKLGKIGKNWGKMAIYLYHPKKAPVPPLGHEP